MKQLLAVHPWSLCQVRCHLLPFCWYWDGGKPYEAEMRDDSLIYRAGFATREAAEAWGKREGILSA